VEKKQKFISQIMTSKSPVRSCEDIDEASLSYAEIKALCAGDPRIKERMELDMEVAKLKIMKADHQSQQFRMEDNVLTRFPAEIKQNQEFIAGLREDMKTLAAHPHPPLIVPAASAEQDGENDAPAQTTGTLTTGFAGMTVKGKTYDTREKAGAAILDACTALTETKEREPVEIGSYRGFPMYIRLEIFSTFSLTLKGQMSHKVELGSTPTGNITRMDNALDKMPGRIQALLRQIDNLNQQMEAAKAEIGKPFPQEDELQQKSARLIQLDAELNLDSKSSEIGSEQAERESAKNPRPSVLDSLKRPLPPRVKPAEKLKSTQQER